MNDLIQTLVPLGNFSILMLLLLASRRWTGPSQATALRDLSDEIRILRGNHSALRRDVDESRRDFSDSLERIWKELQMISKNGAKEHPLEDEMRTLGDRLLDVEQVVASMPCQAACKSTTPEGV